MSETYDLSAFQHLGGIIHDDDGDASTNADHHKSSAVEEDEWETKSEDPEHSPSIQDAEPSEKLSAHEEWESKTYELAPPVSEEKSEAPATQIIFNDVPHSNTRDKRSSLKALVGTVSSIKGRFEKGKRVVSGVFTALGGASDKQPPAVKHHEIPSFQAPPMAKNQGDVQRRTSAFEFQGLPKSTESETAVRRPKKGPPPPLHPMTLAKGWNSGLGPQKATKSPQADF